MRRTAALDAAVEERELRAEQNSHGDDQPNQRLALRREVALIVVGK